MGWLYMFNNWKKKVQPQKGKLSWKFATFSRTKMGKTWHSRKATHRHAQLQIGYQDGSSFIIVHLVSNTLNIFKKHLSKSKSKSSSTTFREVNMKKNLFGITPTIIIIACFAKKKHRTSRSSYTSWKLSYWWCWMLCWRSHVPFRCKAFAVFKFSSASCDSRHTHFYGTMELEIWNT